MLLVSLQRHSTTQLMQIGECSRFVKKKKKLDTQQPIQQGYKEKRHKLTSNQFHGHCHN